MGQGERKMELPPDIPPEAVSFLQEVGYLQADRLQVGMFPPPLVLTSLTNEKVTNEKGNTAGLPVVIGAPDAALPTVLIFGSVYLTPVPPPGRSPGTTLSALSPTCHVLRGLYPRSAPHGWLATRFQPGGAYRVCTAANILARQEIASACMVGLRLTIPALIDAIDNRADLAYNGWPERLYALSSQGEIVYQGGKGPYGFDIDELDRFLEGYLGR